jgi:hypothetical protein
LDPGSEIRDPGWVKIRIREVYPGSATLKIGVKILTWITTKAFQKHEGRRRRIETVI